MEFREGAFDFQTSQQNHENYKERSESNEELEKENERLKIELQKAQSKKWFQIWKQ